MIVGLDCGYSHTKAISGQRRVIFPSVCGNLEQARFSVNSNSEASAIILDEGAARWLVGDEAVRQSRMVSRREDRLWLTSLEYGRLWWAALTEITTANRVEMQIVTGLPVTYFADRTVIRERFRGGHRVKRSGRGAQFFIVTDLMVMPQPFGALLAACLDDRGRIVNTDIAEGRVGVIDVGGKTTGFLSVDALAEIRRETHSVDVGCWEPLRLIGEAIEERWPGLALRDHEIITAVQSGEIRHYGQVQDISDIVAEAIEPLAAEVVATATQRWNGGARLDAIIVTGGGAYLVGEHIEAAFRHAHIFTGDPVFANALGFWRFAQRRWG